MPVASMNRFFALLAILAVGGSVVTLATLIPLGPRARRLRPDIAQVAPWLAFATAATATAGSLYYSEFADFTPCKLCWFQRICMYPLVVVLAVALRRGDRAVAAYAVPLCALGATVSGYHYQLQRFPDQASAVCTLDAPCSASEVWVFGFISIPLMALSGFIAIAILLLAARPANTPVPHAKPQEIVSP
ncbi:MAG: disulfide bond formation protein B [Acidimicrobiales bacterium]